MGGAHFQQPLLNVEMTFDTEVDYNHEQHRYFLGTKVYRSATQIIEQFVEKFDVEERSQYMAHRYGRTPEFWKDEWRKENQKSLLRGNRIHGKEEDFLYNRGFASVNNKQYVVYNLKNLYRSSVHYYKLPDGTYPELKLWRHDWCIAGRADKPTFETVNGVRYSHVEDYKSNKSIGTRGFNGKRLLGPVSHLEDCEYNTITLQLSLYQYMLEYFGFEPGVRRIIHFPHEIEGLGTPKPVTHELPYLRKEVIDMLTHLRSTGWLSS